jgi:chemotaxis regulatin CheY-phosphate phosphatase CheZ
MNRDQLTGKIGELVDVLRTGEARRISMADIASITEVLITTMERYFSSIDTSIYREFQELSDHITAMRTEIARAQPNEISADRIPRAGKELDEVVRATEDATNAIMEAAEEIMSADPSDLAAYQGSVNESCMKIFEACSFQDITGQRVTKVITTLAFIEDRLGAILTAWNPSDEELGEAASEARTGDAALLNGPALAGEGIDQDDVDALLASDEAAPAAPPESASPAPAPTAAAPATAPEVPAPAETAPAAAEAPAPVKAEAEAEDANQTAPAAKPAAKPAAPATAEPQPLAAAPAADPPAPSGGGGEDEKTSQADIDAMFD